MSRKVKATAGTPATVALRDAGVVFRALPYAHDPSVTDYGREAAEALGVAQHEVFKTLVVRLDSGDFGVCVIPVSASADLKAVAAALGGKRAELADPKDVQRLTGYVLGGVSPLGQRTRLATVIDASAMALPEMFVSGGRRGLDIAVGPEDLAELTGAVVADVVRRV